MNAFLDRVQDEASDDEHADFLNDLQALGGADAAEQARKKQNGTT